MTVINTTMLTITTVPPTVHMIITIVVLSKREKKQKIQ